MKKLKLDIQGIEQNLIRYSVERGLDIELLYNQYDGYLYLALLNEKGYMLGHTRLVPNINYTRLNRIETEYDLVCIKINDAAQEKDLVTLENFNKDYSLFLIKRGG